MKPYVVQCLFNIVYASRSTCTHVDIYTWQCCMIIQYSVMSLPVDKPTDYNWPELLCIQHTTFYEQENS